MQNVKIFVASSGEMKDERDKCIEICHQVNKFYPHLKLETVKWETDIPSGSCDRNIQDDINPLLISSDIVIVMFYSKVGIFTLEEYKLAKANNKKVFLYFKKGFSANNKRELNNYAKVLKLTEQLDKENQSLYFKYDTIQEFVNKVQNDLNLYLRDQYSHAIPNSIKTLTSLPPKAVELIGRDDSIERIQTILNEKNRVLLVNGLGGIGKTEVCKKYFWDNYDKFEHVGWINYTSSIKESLVNQIDGLEFAKDEGIDERYIKTTKYLCDLSSNTLLVIDNIENIDDENIRDISCFPFKVIASSRMSFEDYFEEYRLDFLDDKACRELFCRHFKGDVWGEESAYLDKIIKLAGQHTLTIELLAKTAQSRGISVGQLYQELDKSGFSLKGIKEKIVTIWHNGKEKKRFFEHMEKVFELADVTDGEKHILANLSVLPSLPLAKNDVRKWLGLEDSDDINSLVKKGWINEKEQNIIMHQVVGEVVRHKLQPDVKCCEKLIDSFIWLLKCEPGDNPFDKVGYIVYGEYILKSVNGDNEDIATLANNLCTKYYAKGELDKALECQLKALEIYEKVLGKEHPSLATSYNNLSSIYQAKGELDKALEYQLKAVEIREKVLGKEQPDLATSYNNLCTIYYTKGEPDKALEYQLKAVGIKEKVLGKEHPSLAISYNNLSSIYQAKRELDKALEYQLKAVEIREKVLGKEHPDLAQSYNNLSQIYQDKGELDKALEYQLKDVKILEKVLGKEHADLATSYNNLSQIYQDKGELDKALEYQLKAVEISEKVQGKEHPDLAISYGNLASIYFAYKEYQKAYDYCERAVKILENKFPNGHPNLKAYSQWLAYYKRYV